MFTTTLNNGIQIPNAGFGTFPLKEELMEVIPLAFKYGYRFFDSAMSYGNEEWLGYALESLGPKKNECFISTKYCHPSNRSINVRQAFDRSREKLGIQTIDLFLMHFPYPDAYVEIWRQMEEIYKEGLCKAIGVCNFTEQHLSELLNQCDIIPAVNQIEVHPLFTRKPLIDFCTQNNIRIISYSPLARMHEKIIGNETIKKIAKKYNKTVPQTILRWNMQKKLIAIPAAQNENQIRENSDIYNFELSESEILDIDDQNENFRIRYDSDIMFLKDKHKSSVQKILLIGGTGVISSEVARQAIEKNINVTMINRGNRRLFIPDKATLIQADCYDYDYIKEIVKDETYDVVIDFLAYRPSQVSGTLSVFRDKCKQYIFISSATIYSKHTQAQNFTEESLVENFEWGYCGGKIACEMFLEQERLRNGLNYTVVRPYVTYGDTRFPYATVGTNYWSLAQRMLDRKPIVVWDDGQALCTITHSSDFARGLMYLMMNEDAYGQAYHITSDEVMSWQRVAEQIAAALETDIRFSYVPSSEIIKIMPDARGELLFDKGCNNLFDNTKYRSLNPKFLCDIPFSVGIRKTVAFYQKHPEYRVCNKMWDSKMDILSDMYPPIT